MITKVTLVAKVLRINVMFILLFNDVQDYIQQCVKCQRSKLTNQLPHGLLQTLEIPGNRWQSVSIDFITGLPNQMVLMQLIQVLENSIYY